MPPEETAVRDKKAFTHVREGLMLNAEDWDKKSGAGARVHKDRS